MHLTGTVKDDVKSILSKIQTKENLLALLNAVKQVIEKPKEGKSFQPIELQELTFFADQRLSGSIRYRSFSIKKKNGTERVISTPIRQLKQIQQLIATILSTTYEPANSVNGFVPLRSIVDNARPHVGKRFVYNVDLKDFFPSIQQQRVKTVLTLPPFNLSGDREPIAYLIARLCCIKHPDNTTSLPQGAPTSPLLSNIICQQLDRRLGGLSKRFGAVYTRYADDITFSAEANIFHGSFEKEMRRIVDSQRFIINQSKVRMQGQGYRQEVTGLTVNVKANVSKHYIGSVRAMLHNWQKLGYEQAEAIFKIHYSNDKGHVKPGKPILTHVLHGKLNYLRMVRGAEDPLFKRYWLQFETLAGRKPVDPLAKLEKLLSLWESSGFNTASKDGTED